MWVRAWAIKRCHCLSTVIGIVLWCKCSKSVNVLFFFKIQLSKQIITKYDHVFWWQHLKHLWNTFHHSEHHFHYLFLFQCDCFVILRGCPQKYWEYWNIILTILDLSMSIVRDHNINIYGLSKLHGAPLGHYWIKDCFISIESLEQLYIIICSLVFCWAGWKEKLNMSVTHTCNRVIYAVCLGQHIKKAKEGRGRSFQGNKKTQLSQIKYYGKNVLYCKSVCMLLSQFSMSFWKTVKSMYSLRALI